jgi:hypothetical protein
MSKKHYIAMAEAIKHHNQAHPEKAFAPEQLDVIAAVFKQQNAAFNYPKFLAYIEKEQK